MSPKAFFFRYFFFLALNYVKLGHSVGCVFCFISSAPQLVCPEGQRVVSTSVGSICVPKSQPVSTAFEFPEPLRKVPGEGGTTKPFREQRTTQSGDLTPKLHPRLEVPATTKPVLTFGTALTTETDLESVRLWVDDDTQ